MNHFDGLAVIASAGINDENWCRAYTAVVNKGNLSGKIRYEEHGWKSGSNKEIWSTDNPDLFKNMVIEPENLINAIVKAGGCDFVSNDVSSIPNLPCVLEYTEVDNEWSLRPV
jgi:hypothetical protein